MENLFAQNTLVVNQKFTILNNQYQVLDTKEKKLAIFKKNLLPQETFCN